MTGIIWHIYTEYLKKEKAALEAARNKERERLERNRRIPETGAGAGQTGSDDFFRVD